MLIEPVIDEGCPTPTGCDLDTTATRTLAHLARRAHRCRARGPAAMAALAKRHGMGVRDLRLLADAWAEGGQDGIVALGPATEEEADRETIQQAAAAIQTWRDRHYPLDLLEIEVRGNRLTVWQLVANDDDRRGAPQRRSLLQVRRTSGGRWHLYRRAAQGEWWPVTVGGRRAPQSLDDCLKAVHVNSAGQFWTGNVIPQRPSAP